MFSLFNILIEMKTFFFLLTIRIWVMYFNMIFNFSQLSPIVISVGTYIAPSVDNILMSLCRKWKFLTFRTLNRWIKDIVVLLDLHLFDWKQKKNNLIIIIICPVIWMRSKMFWVLLWPMPHPFWQFPWKSAQKIFCNHADTKKN